jgi:hypothetical protein
MSDLSALVVVGDTPVGRGVFAVRRFAKDDVIAEVAGQLILDPDYSSHYCVDLGGSVSLEPDPPFRFLNHSCEPNCELFQWSDEEGDDCDIDNDPPQLWIAALRTIRPGEELTIDYAWPADVAIRCLCKAPKCRGWIVDPEELPLVKKHPLECGDLSPLSAGMATERGKRK